MQLKVEDLRVGNLVYSGINSNEIIKVYPMFLVQFSKIQEEEHNIKPIPLTEEWLIKFGGIDNVYTIEIGQLQFTWASRIIATGERCSWSCEQYPHIQYIHQLQNLYFALNNEELTCN